MSKRVADVRDTIDAHRALLIEQRDEMNERIDRLDRALAIIDGDDLVTRPSARGRPPKLLPPAPRAARPRVAREPVERQEAKAAPSGGRAPPLGDAVYEMTYRGLVRLGKKDPDRWVVCAELGEELNLGPQDTRKALMGLRARGRAENNDLWARASRWRAIEGGARATPATPARKARKAAAPEPERAEAGGDEPARGTVAARILTRVRRAGARGISRQHIAESVMVDIVNVRAFVTRLVAKGLVQIEGDRGEQRVVAVEKAKAAPDEQEEQGQEQEEQEDTPEPPREPPPPVAPPRATKAPPVPRNPPPIVHPAVAGPKATPKTPEEPAKTKAEPLAERRVVRPELITDPKDRFHCKPLSMSMDAGVCVQRQEIANSDPKGASSEALQQRKLRNLYMTNCAKCPLGKQVAARLREFSS